MTETETTEPTPTETPAPKAPRNKCLVDGCGRDEKTRGLCASHYQQFRVAIANGKTTEDAEIEAGRILPRKPQGRRRVITNPFPA